MKIKRLRVALLSLLCVLLAALEPARADDSAERSRIARERADAQARFEARRRECETRFAVTACVDEARAEHRQALQRLRREEGVLDEAQRRQRAAARMAAIEARQRAERERANAPRAERPVVSPQLRPPRPPAAAPKAASTPASAPDRSAEEARSRARFEARRREAREHREQAEQRREQREQSGKKAAPLPDPAAR